MESEAEVFNGQSMSLAFVYDFGRVIVSWRCNEKV